MVPSTLPHCGISALLLEPLLFSTFATAETDMPMATAAAQAATRRDDCMDFPLLDAFRTLMPDFRDVKPCPGTRQGRKIWDLRPVRVELAWPDEIPDRHRNPVSGTGAIRARWRVR